MCLHGAPQSCLRSAETRVEENSSIETYSQPRHNGPIPHCHICPSISQCSFFLSRGLQRTPPSPFHGAHAGRVCALHAGAKKPLGPARRSENISRFIFAQKHTRSPLFQPAPDAPPRMAACTREVVDLRRRLSHVNAELRRERRREAAAARYAYSRQSARESLARKVALALLHVQSHGAMVAVRFLLAQRHKKHGVQPCASDTVHRWEEDRAAADDEDPLEPRSKVGL